MTDNRTVIGVDGGGTKTNGLLMNAEGEELARASFPSSNIHSNPHNVVRDVLQDLVSGLCRDAGVQQESVAAIALGMAGCDGPAEKAALESFLRPVLAEDTKIAVINDALVAMRAVLRRMHGILLIAGTGSICFGWNERTGENSRCGGWGHLLADEGSGYRIGMEGMRAVLKAVDGRGPKTTLHDRVLDELGYPRDEPRSILQFVYNSEKGTKANIAAMARLVMEEDANGDEAAGKVLDDAAAELATLIPPVYHGLFAEEDGTVPLGLWGGNLVHVEAYRRRLEKALEPIGLPLKTVMDADADAVVGAARHALTL